LRVALEYNLPDSKQRFFRKDDLLHGDPARSDDENHPTGSSSKQPISNKERRGSRRCKITQLMRIRPSDPNKDHFEDLRGSVSVSRSGVFFQSSEPVMKLACGCCNHAVFENPASMAREYLAEVVRRDVLPTGMFGVESKSS